MQTGFFEKKNFTGSYQANPPFFIPLGNLLDFINKLYMICKHSEINRHQQFVTSLTAAALLMKLTQRNMFAYLLYITIAHNSSRVILLVILVSKVHCIRFRIKCNNDKETNFLYSVIIELSKGLNNCFLYYGMATFYFCFICINTFYNRCKLL